MKLCYTLDTTVISHVCLTRDLGVYIDTEISFNRYACCQYVSSMYLTTLGTAFVFSCYFIPLYNATLRLNVMWNSIGVTKLSSIEHIQR